MMMKISQKYLRNILRKLKYSVFGELFPSEEPPKDAKKGEGLKIMTPNQLLTRLPILLAQKSRK